MLGTAVDHIGTGPRIGVGEAVEINQLDLSARVIGAVHLVQQREIAGAHQRDFAMDNVPGILGHAVNDLFQHWPGIRAEFQIVLGHEQVPVAAQRLAPLSLPVALRTLSDFAEKAANNQLSSASK